MVFHGDVIVLAEDEARMLGQLAVEPEHLLLALARRSQTEGLLGERGVSASDVRAAIVRTGGLGDELAVGRLPRSPATWRVLERAFDIAAERGVLGPDDEHLLLALGHDERAMAVLCELGVGDLAGVVEARYPPRRAPRSHEQVKSYLFRAAMSESALPVWPAPPVFERFTVEAQRAVRAAVESAALLENDHVEPFHLLLGCLHVPDSLAGRVLARELAPSDMGTLGEAMERARMYGPNPAHQAPGRFTDATRRLVAEEALKQAYRHDHDLISTGHLLLATLDSLDAASARMLGTGVMGAGPVSDRIAREVLRALPGEEHPSDARSGMDPPRRVDHAADDRGREDPSGMDGQRIRPKRRDPSQGPRISVSGRLPNRSRLDRRSRRSRLRASRAGHSLSA